MNNLLGKTGGRLLLLLVLMGFITTCSGAGDDAGGGTAKVSLDQVPLYYPDISVSKDATSGNTSSPDWNVTHSEITYSITPDQTWGVHRCKRCGNCGYRHFDGFHGVYRNGNGQGRINQIHG